LSIAERQSDGFITQDAERYMRSRLTEIANEAGTDKGTVHGDAQGYTLIYEILFEPLRFQTVNLLEVGSAIGGPEHGFPASREVFSVPSVQMWHTYFPNAKLFGVDISDFSAFRTEWFDFYRVDCGVEEQLDELVADLNASGVALDIVVDDASHASFHQQLTMLKLFPLVKPGGFYVIEDLNWQPEAYEACLPEVPKTTKFLEGLSQNGRLANTGSIPEEIWSPVVSRIGSTILIDEGYLLHLRRGYNIRAKVRAERASNLETSWSKRFLRRRHLRQCYEQLHRAARVCLTGVAPPSGGRVSLAVIQKQCT
jgi:hypothetical protein